MGWKDEKFYKSKEKFFKRKWDWNVILKIYINMFFEKDLSKLERIRLLLVETCTWINLTTLFKITQLFIAQLR